MTKLEEMHARAVAKAGGKIDVKVPEAAPVVQPPAAVVPAEPPATIVPPPEKPVEVPAETPTPAPAAPDMTGIPDFLIPPPQVPVAALAHAEPEGMTEPQKVNFASLRKAKEAAEAKLAQVFENDGKVKPDFLKGLNIQSPDVSQIVKERDEALDALAKFDLARDPRWQAKYASAENGARQSILKIAKEFEVDAKDVDTALKLPLKDRIKLLNDKMPDAIPLIAPHLARLDEISVQKESDLSTAREQRKVLDQQYSALQEQTIAKSRDAIYEQMVREGAETKNLAFTVIPGNENWNKGVEGTNAPAK